MLFGLGKNKGKTGKSGKRDSNDSHLTGSSGAGQAGQERERQREAQREAQRERGRASASSRRAGISKLDGRKSRFRGGVNKLFHGVAVRSRGDAACEAVKALGGQRFLSEDAPLLPLAKCSNPQGCRCVYEHFDERRDNLRRGVDVGMPERLHPEEKREGHGRRITDG